VPVKQRLGALDDPCERAVSGAGRRLAFSLFCDVKVTQRRGFSGAASKKRMHVQTDENYNKAEVGRGAGGDAHVA
jgi:hypothetical protein